VSDHSEFVPRGVRLLVLLGWFWIGGLAAIIIATGLSQSGALRTESLLAGAAVALAFFIVVYRNWRVVVHGTPSAQIHEPYGPHVVRGVGIAIVMLILLTAWLLRRSHA